MAISLTSKVNKKYRRRATLIIVALLIFIVVPFLIPQKKVTEGTKVGSSVDNGNSLVYLQSATYYEENRLLEVAFLSQGKDIGSEDFNVSVVAKNEKNKTYPIKVEKVNDSYSVVFITNVPDNFKQVKVVLTDKNKSSEMFEATLDPFIITPKNSITEQTFTVKGVSDYQKNYLDGLIAIQEDHLQLIDNQIKEFKKQIARLEKSSSDVTADVELMTGTEKQKAMDKIKQNTSQITQIKNQIKTKEEEKTEYKEKIKRVENAQ